MGPLGRPHKVLYHQVLYTLPSSDLICPRQQQQKPY